MSRLLLITSNNKRVETIKTICFSSPTVATSWFLNQCFVWNLLKEKWTSFYSIAKYKIGMLANWLLFWIILVCFSTFRPALAENVQLDLTTANGYQWQASLPNGSKSNNTQYLRLFWFIILSRISLFFSFLLLLLECLLYCTFFQWKNFRPRIRFTSWRPSSGRYLYGSRASQRPSRWSSSLPI